MANFEKIYPIMIGIFSILAYYWLVFITYIKHFDNDPVSIIYLVFFHISFFMLIWSFITTLVVSPGRPPVFWVI